MCVERRVYILLTVPSMYTLSRSKFALNGADSIHNYWVPNKLRYSEFALGGQIFISKKTQEVDEQHSNNRFIYTTWLWEPAQN